MPMTPPPPAAPVQTPIAFPRSSSGKAEVITARVIGMIIAAPAPLRTRAASMIPAVGASPLGRGWAHDAKGLTRD